MTKLSQETYEKCMVLIDHALKREHECIKEIREYGYLVVPGDGYVIEIMNEEKKDHFINQCRESIKYLINLKKEIDERQRGKKGGNRSEPNF